MLRNYLKVAFKVLLRRKFFTFISLFAISFTLVVLVVVTALLDNTFGAEAPETRADRTIGIFWASMHGEMNTRSGRPGYKLLDTYARDLPGVEKFSICSSDQTISTFLDGRQIQLSLKRTDGEYWQILDFSFLEGGPFTSDDEKNANHVAVINEATRQKFFGESSAVGQSITIENQSFQVVGVVSNIPIYRTVPYSEVWVPISTATSDSYKKELVGSFMGILLARDASAFPAIREEWKARMAGVDLSDFRDFTEVNSSAGTLFEFVAEQTLGEQNGAARMLGVIGFVMFVFMLLPAINLVNINISRIQERSSEIGVRKAFGASSWTLVGQFLVENIAVTLVGGLIGFLLSIVILRIISASGVMAYADLTVNIRIFLIGLGLALFFGVLSGVYPAWRMSRLDPVDALKGGLR